jgi:CHAT domain-containing protein/Tfp pilus assembly protein PilF
MTKRAVVVAAALLAAVAFMGGGSVAAQDDELVRARALDQQIIQLFRQRNYADALKLAQETLAIRQKALGPEHPEVATNFDTVGLMLNGLGRAAEAEPLFRQSLAIREKALGSEDATIALSLTNVADLCRNQRRYDEAEPLYKRSLAIREKALGPDHPLVLANLNALAALYQAQRREADAEPLYARIVASQEKAFGVEDPRLVASLNTLAVVDYGLARYAEAEPAFKRALAIQEKVHGADSADVVPILNNLAALYNAQGRYGDAASLYQRVLAIQEKAPGTPQLDIALILNNLGGVYYALGRYAEAEPAFKRALAIREKALGGEHADVAVTLDNLAALNKAQGRTGEAEALYKRALAVRETALGPDDPDIANTLGNLANLYEAQARYAEAEPLFRRSLAILEAALGADHPRVANTLNNLASLYEDQGNYTESDPLYRRALAIYEKTLGPGHPNVAVVLNNLGRSRVAQQRYAEAEPLYRRALAIREKELGPEHPDTAATLNNLAVLYDAEQRYAEAEVALRQSLAIARKTLGPEHPDVAANLDNLAGVLRAQSRFGEALAASGEAVGILAKRIGVTASSQDSGAHAERRGGRRIFLQNIALVYGAGDKTSAAETFRVEQLANASSVAQALAGMAARFAAGSDTLAQIVRQRQDLASRRQRLDASILGAAGKPPSARDPAAEAALRMEMAELVTRLDALDADIARDFPNYAELSNPKPLDIGDLQPQLATDEAMLVYLIGESESWLWALRRDRTELYKLTIGGKALAAEVAALRERLDPISNPDLIPFDAKRANALYDIILAPAAALLEGAHRVFIVPDGALDSLPLGVLVTKPPAAEPDNPADHRSIAWFARDYAVAVLPSAGALKALRQVAGGGEAPEPFVGFGNPVLAGEPGAVRGVKPASLFRGAAADVEAVRQLPPLPETAGEQNLYLAERFTEPMLREAGLDRYRVIEFATHGLMSGDLKGLAEPALVLTPPQEASAENDGLLTASKVATLKLNAEWVVLSACNTAAADGTPDAGGLSGLAKAFFYAGARSLLVSNWSVPSEATVKLVTGAFDELKKDPKIGRAEALRRAEMAMLDPEAPPEFAHPMMWAPFILAGEGGAGR